LIDRCLSCHECEFMSKIFTKGLFFLVLITAFSYSVAFAQSITISNVVTTPGSYGAGSTIAVPFHVNDASCVNTNNIYSLYLCNTAGVVIAGAPVDTIRNFYGNFFNFTVPTGLAPGSYTFKVTSSSPAITSSPSNIFTIGTGTGVAVAVNCTSSVSTISNPTYPDVFGTCSGEPNTTYTFTNATTGAATVSASFFNETSQTTVLSNQLLVPAYNFVADTTNYTVTVVAITAAGVISTHDYKLINNVVNTSIGSTGSLNVCLASGSAPLTYNIDVSSPTGIEYNYPGNIYMFKWGDGTTSTYTLCQIEALNGQISHNYSTSSCGLNPNASNPNSFEIDFKSENIYCGQVGSAPSNFAKVLIQPSNSFIAPVTGCTNTAVTFTNNSQPGPDPNAPTATCSSNPNAVYSWSVQLGAGPIQVKQTGLKLSQPFVYTFPTHGTYTVYVHLQNPPTGSSCVPADYSQSICIQDPPQPSFTLTPAQTTICNATLITPTNTSVIDATCNTNNQYLWTVSPTTGVIYAGGTTSASAQPTIGFGQSGIYTIKLNITTQSCGNTYTTPTQTIVVNTNPTATLSAAFTACGKGQTFDFNNTNPTTNKTYTVLTGTAQATATTYTWTVTPAAGGTYSFVNPTTANSEYPDITFNDYDTYTVTVTQTNGCNTATASQNITFVPSPTIQATSTASNICAGSPINLGATTTGTFLSYKWSSPTTGTFTPNSTSETTTYQPSAADIAAGQVILTITGTTAIAAPCNSISSSVTVTITPTDVITSTLAKTICSNTQVGYTATALNPGSTFTWTASVTSGQATGFTLSGSGSAINDLLVNTDPTATTNAVVSYVITPTSANGCPGTPSTLKVTVTPLPILTATPPTAPICSGNPAGITLSSSVTAKYTWSSTAPAGVTGNTNQPTATSVTGIQDVLINTGTTAATVTYTVTPVSASGCTGTSVPVSVIVEPAPVTANAGGPVPPLCNVTSYQLQGNSPGTGTGLWTVVSGSGTTFTDPTSPTTTVNGLVGGTQYTFMWTITSAPGCSSSSQVVITVNVPTIPGITLAAGGDSTVCSGSNSGQINLTGQTGTILRWEKSTDGGATWTTAQTGNTASITFLNLTQTTAYRAIVQNGSCGILPSTITTITVNQAAIIANAGTNQSLCNGLTYALNGNNPGTFSANWTQISGPPVIFSDPTNPQTTVSGLNGGNVYDFRWTIHAVTPCADSYADVIITDKANVVPSFTASQTNVCGPTTITLTNTSNDIPTASFLWDFGDGATSTIVSPQHQFEPATDGQDTTYTVTLSVVGNCSPQPPATQVITVHPATPIASISVNQLTGCSPFTITAKNTSPGNNPSYAFYLYNGATLVQEIDKTDKTDASFNPISVTSTQTFTLYMVATGYCGTTTTTNKIPIQIAPPSINAQMFILNGANSGCAPLSVFFVNNSTGGSTFHYNIYDSNGNLIAQPIAGTANLPYTFTTAGTYNVSITASNTCSPTGVESPTTQVIVYPLPQPAFTYNTDCSNNVTFANTTPANGSTPATSLSYAWDFGDGSPVEYTFTPAVHSYDYTKSPFTVTLTATNTASGCPNVYTQQLTINQPLVADFTVLPDSIIDIPNYRFNFVDKSAGGPTSWQWQFSDGSSSSSQNPQHTYADTGLRTVTLVISNGTCTSTITRHVRITGTPGQLYMPNAFIPTSGVTELKTFMAKGSGIKIWHMQIFNNYGQLVWETTKLDSKGAPIDGWDGTFKGAPAPQGAYFWQASATFINGTKWKGMSYNNSLPKTTGTVNLIR
jgi:PKD repeat protein